MLSDLKAKNAKATGKGYCLADSDGLHLFVTEAGGKIWRMRVKAKGKEKLLTFGPYPAMSLISMGTKRDGRVDARAAGGHPER